MAPFAILQYDPTQPKRPRTKGVFKPISDYDGEPRTKPRILPVGMPQPRVVADGVSGLIMREKDSNSQKSTDRGVPTIMGRSKKVSGSENDDIQIELDFLFDETDDIFNPKNNLTTNVDGIVTEADAESKVGSTEIQDSDVEFGTDDIESGMRDIGTIHDPLKHGANTGRRGSKDNVYVIPDSDTESESEDGLLWKKRRVSHSLVGRLRSWRRMIDETDNERVGGNGEWGIHGIIGKEVIEGKVYYCVDWEPTMMPLDELWGAERLVREFEAKEQEENVPHTEKETPRLTSEAEVRRPPWLKNAQPFESMRVGFMVVRAQEGESKVDRCSFFLSLLT
ncbi:MAG: hypothetical protein M1839_006173 [Geoglossum umbratile]|nr:MAG: hypothetical protein M1839_006173 [Geoglossum umbratile]